MVIENSLNWFDSYTISSHYHLVHIMHAIIITDTEGRNGTKFYGFKLHSSCLFLFVYVAFSFGIIFFYRFIVVWLVPWRDKLLLLVEILNFFSYHHLFPKLISVRMNWIVSSRIIVWSKIHVFMYVFIQFWLRFNHVNVWISRLRLLC